MSDAASVAQRPVCVLSVGRSGTSLATRVINLLGVNLGPEERMLQACDHQPAGFWEQRSLVWLNELILRARGGTWSKPPAPQPDWERAPEMEPYRLRMEKLVEQFFGDGKRWGFKDPRTTFTLPMWQSVVGEFDYVICLRNPLEVTASGLPAGAEGFDLWLHYSCEALRVTADRRRMFVFYEDWFDDPLAVGRSLARFLHGGSEAMEAVVDATSFFDPSLHRRRATQLDLARREDIPLAVRTLHFLARDLAAAEARGDLELAQALQALAVTMDGRSGGERATA